MQKVTSAREGILIRCDGKSRVIPNRGIQMAKKRSESPRRFRNIPANASIEAAERAIVRTLGLPDGSIRLVLPSGRKARRDATVQSLKDHWA
jgi:hypothetical protein